MNNYDIDDRLQIVNLFPKRLHLLPLKPILNQTQKPVY
jgi:hypothetical protein